MACCGARGANGQISNRSNTKTVTVVVAPDGPTESVWPSWREARYRASQLGTGYRPEQRRLNLDDGLVDGKRINRPCCGH